MATDTGAATGTSRRYVLRFREGNRDQRELLGGKGANLAEMTNLGLPVPPGFIVTTDACRAYLSGGGELPDGLLDEVHGALRELEEEMGRGFGDPKDPLLVSVRSGAPFSMPGMMDTVLNVGLSMDVTEGLAEVTGDARFAWDSNRRLVQLYSTIVLGLDGELFDEEVEKVGGEAHLDTEGVKRLAERFREIVKEQTGEPFPDDPWQQLKGAVEAVFNSWNSRRARNYRQYEGIPDDVGTAVNVQTMVFGNRSEDSGTGVAFTRDPATGEAVAYGDWLDSAQGEDVVAGIRETKPLSALADEHPQAHAELMDAMHRLEQHWRDLCDVEFTLESDKLWILQTRVGKRSAAAAVRIAVEMVDEGLISVEEAIQRVKPSQLEQLLHPQIDDTADFEVLTTGLAASPGAATGKIALTADDAAERAERGETVMLVRVETSPDDLHGLIAAEGVLTARGGLVSHAAVIARGMGTPAVVGASEVAINREAGTVTVNDTVLRDGDEITICGSTGRVIPGSVPLVEASAEVGSVGRLLDWADDHRRLKIRANADTGEDARRSVEAGGQGIGLCRTEHMFLGDRLPVVQRMIIAETDDEVASALEELGRVQREDFRSLLREMDGLPVTVRLLDPPLHEFLPDVTEWSAREAKGELDEWEQKLLAAARDRAEVNPMLGTRGLRLGILRPEIYRMQVRSLIQAAADVKGEGLAPEVEIMIPLTVEAKELATITPWIEEEAREVLADGPEIRYHIGTMIETPRAALTSGAIAEHAEFFSYGTNDLTQMTWAFSRDDVERLVIPRYMEDGILDVNPFAELDPEAVTRLLEISVREGKEARPDLETGICGEHGGDPTSIHIAHRVGLDYVSCSPFRIPVARLAAAHAALGTAKVDATA